MFESFIKKLESRIKEGLPGVESHRKMTFKERRVDFQAPETAVKAGVMIVLYPDSVGEVQMVFIKRKSIEGDVHKGQISFPGGKLEQSDQNVRAAAIRETHEEIGVLVPQGNVIGALTKLYIPVSNFEVYPFVSYIPEQPSFIMEVSELDEIIETPLRHFQDPFTLKKKHLLVGQNFMLKNVPYFDLMGHTLWGATAMMTAEFIDLLEDI